MSYFEKQRRKTQFEDAHEALNEEKMDSLPEIRHLRLTQMHRRAILNNEKAATRTIIPHSEVRHEY